MLNQESVLNALKNVIYPGFKKSIVEFGFVKQTLVHENRVALTVEIPGSAEHTVVELREAIAKELAHIGVESFEIDIKQPGAPRETSSKGKNIAPHIKNFIMVSSGKGGVGKSTTAVNLAVAMAMDGLKIGLLDADIYGPNIPRMMGVSGQKPEVVGNSVKPLNALGVEVMSMGLIYEDGQSLIWRGPMIMRAVEQLLRDVQWGELDALVIDMPPGTGDAQLTLAQSVPVTAGVTVTTPQEVSLDDSRRSLDMFKKLHIPLAGIIENMSGFICPDSGKEYDIFGKGTTKKVADEFETVVLGDIPIEPAIRIGGDEGKPVVYYNSDSITAQRYRKAAHNLWEYVKKINESGGSDNSAIQPVPSAKSACSM